MLVGQVANQLPGPIGTIGLAIFQFVRVKRELVDAVYSREDAPANHRASARTVRSLIDEGWLTVRSPDFDRSGHLVDEARRRLASDELPEHEVAADQYLPALACELAAEGPVVVVTGDVALRRVVRTIADREGLAERFASITG